MRRRRNHRGASVLGLALLASAALHLAIAPGFSSLLDRLFRGVGGPERPVRVVQLTPEQWSQNLRTRGAAPQAPARPTPQAAPAPGAPAPAPEPPVPAKDEPVKGQVVQVPPSADNAPNPSAKLLSKYNSRTDRETMARDRDPSKKRVTSKLQQGERGDDEAGLRTPNLSLKGNGAEDRAGQAAEQEFVLKMPDIPRRDAVDLNREKGAGPGILNRRATEAIRGNSDRFDLQLGKERGQEGQTESTRGVENGEGKQIPTLSALMPNFGTLSRISGSPSMDHVEGVLEGDGTFLNTKEFKYATFFYRVQDSVYDHWVGAALREYRRRDPTGNIYGVQDRATLLSISLDRDGSLDDVRVEKGSGVDFLDLVAVEAFRKAQPFPNPPQGIVDDDGRIRFNFKFVVTVGSGSGLNLFRRY